MYPVAHWLSILFGLACLYGGLPARADVIVRERTEYFDVSGRNGAELGRALLKGGARHINKRHAIAATGAAYEIGRADIGVENGRCIVRDVDVILDITYYFPRWRGGGSRRLRDRWKAFYAELVRHEHTHGQIAKEGAAELERELEKTSGTVLVGCRDFGSFSGIRLGFVTSRVKQRHIAFDRRENRRTSRISRLQIALIETE